LATIFYFLKEMLKLLLAILITVTSFDDLFVPPIYCVDLTKLYQSMDDADKCGQMTQLAFQVIEKEPIPANSPISPDYIPVDMAKLRTVIVEKRVGSIMNTGYDYAQEKVGWQRLITDIEQVAMETKLKIPVIYGVDSIHGATFIREAVLFPQPLSMAATFNVDIAFRVGEITAMETRAVGVPWNFNPVLDLGRQPLWSR
jgi:beta-glucosidase